MTFLKIDNKSQTHGIPTRKKSEWTLVGGNKGNKNGGKKKEHSKQKGAKKKREHRKQKGREKRMKKKGEHRFGPWVHFKALENI
jgi:hypothetical protein